MGPTLLDGVQPEMRVYREEIFGPVVGMTPVNSLDEAIAMINAAEYGNAASIFTESGAAARRFRYEVETGNIGINVGVAAPVAYFPFSGAKHSFFGTLHPQGRDAFASTPRARLSSPVGRRAMAGPSQGLAASPVYRSGRSFA